MLRRPERRVVFLLLLPAVLCGWLVFPSSVEGGVSFAGIERVGVQPPGSLSLDVGLQGESGRQLSPGIEYDNVRLHPLGVRYGLTERLELGAGMGASFNSGHLEEDDVEFASLTGKYRWNRALAVTLSLSQGLGERVFPYGGDGLGLDLNLPAEYPFGPGRLIGQLGYRVNRGEAAPSIPWSNYLRYGVGYAYEMTRRFEVVAELAGHGPTVELPGTPDRKHQALAFLAHYQPGRASTITPRLAVGLEDGSPDVALGVGYRMEFGLPEPIRRPYRDTAPAAVTPDTRPRGPLLLPEGEGTGGPSGTDAARRRRLTERARRAYETGDLRQAIRLYERARTIGNPDGQILSNLGSLYFRRGNYRRARDRYRQALETMPDDYHTHLYLGITYQRLGRTDRARAHYRRARELRPDAEEPRRRLRTLREGPDG